MEAPAAKISLSLDGSANRVYNYSVSNQRELRMISKTAKTLLALLLAAVLCAAAFSACSGRKPEPVPVNTAAPDQTEQSAEASDNPAESDTPAESLSPGETEPALTEEPSGSEPAPDETPSGTADPSSQPSDVTAAPTQQTGTVTAAPTSNVTAAPGVTASPTANVTVSPTPTATPKPTSTPAPIATQTPKPSATPKPDPVVSLTWLQLDTPVSCDLDFDGKAEKVEVTEVESGGSKLVSLKVTNGSTGQVLMDSVTCDTFVNGLINNFNSGDKRVEILLSLSSGTRDDVVMAYRLNSKSNGLLKCSEPGTVDSVTGNNLKVNRLLDLLGTWHCSAVFAFDYKDFKLLRSESDWMVQPEEGRWCTVAHDFIAGVYINGNDNNAQFIYTGTPLYPTSTDLSGRMEFTTDTGLRGYLEITVNSAGRVLTVNGYEPDYLFSDLSYIQ